MKKVLRESMTSSTNTGARSRETYHHGDLRQTLIDAAFDEVASQYADAINLSALARRLGVSQSAPYRHFADREELMMAVGAKAFQFAAAWMREEMDRAPPQSGVSRLAHAFLGFGLTHPGLYKLMYASNLMQSAPVDSEVFAAAEAITTLSHEALGPDLDKSIRRRVVVRLWTSLHGAIMLTEQGLLPTRVTKTGLTELVDDLVKDFEHVLTESSRQ